MDTSKEYIEMCQTAEEIQKLKNPVLGDIVIDKETKSGKRSIVVVDSATLIMYIRNPQYLKTDIWLPRQDQLQEMLEYKTSIVFIVGLGHFIDKYKQDIDSKIYQYVTLEQMYLAWLMEKKYNKQWNNQSKQWEVVN